MHSVYTHLWPWRNKRLRNRRGSLAIMRRKAQDHSTIRYWTKEYSCRVNKICAGQFDECVSFPGSTDSWVMGAREGKPKINMASGGLNDTFSRGILRVLQVRSSICNYAWIVSSAARQVILDSLGNIKVLGPHYERKSDRALLAPVVSPRCIAQNTRHVIGWSFCTPSRIESWLCVTVLTVPFICCQKRPWKYVRLARVHLLGR